ncbi:MAG: zinc ribbon domain-containing protein [Candidatus Freyarchaeum deiterrae]
MPEDSYKYCYHCGTQMEISDTYCPKCGAAAPPPPKFCIICGKKLAPNTKFCSRCGFEQTLPESVEELEDLNNVKYIFVRDNAGLALYEQPLLISNEFNADLLAGFTTAISDFSVELGKKGIRGLIFQEKKGTTSRMLAEVGEYVTVVALMNYESRSVNKKLKLLVKRIEKDCATNLKNWKGNVAEIRQKIIPIVEEVLKVSRLQELEEQQKLGKTRSVTQTENETSTEETTSVQTADTNDQTKDNDTSVNSQYVTEKNRQARNGEIRL